jgi:tetrahydromethanopterin S-methyltransferase subunit G
MKPIYLTDKDFDNVDKKLDKIEAEIYKILSMPTINWKKLNTCSNCLEDIKEKLQNTIDFAENTGRNYDF